MIFLITEDFDNVMTPDKKEYHKSSFSTENRKEAVLNIIRNHSKYESASLKEIEQLLISSILSDGYDKKTNGLLDIIENLIDQGAKFNSQMSSNLSSFYSSNRKELKTIDSISKIYNKKCLYSPSLWDRNTADFRYTLSIVEVLSSKESLSKYFDSEGLSKINISGLFVGKKVPGTMKVAGVGDIIPKGADKDGQENLCRSIYSTVEYWNSLYGNGEDDSEFDDDSDITTKASSDNITVADIEELSEIELTKDFVKDKTRVSNLVDLVKNAVSSTFKL